MKRLEWQSATAPASSALRERLKEMADSRLTGAKLTLSTKCRISAGGPTRTIGGSGKMGLVAERGRNLAALSARCVSRVRNRATVPPHNGALITAAQ